MPVFNPPGGPPGPPVQFGPAQTNDSVNGGYGYSGTGTFAEDRYFYHHDHLGSSSYLTNQLGNITQHVEYIPFGEVFVEERNDKWNTPYLFNGKELDEETGLYYYGARYLDQKLSIWLSVDPLAEHSPDKTPYHYCSNNPINRTYPNGMCDDPNCPHSKLTGSNNLLVYINEPNIKTNYEQMRKISGNFDFIAVDNIDQVSVLLQSHYGKNIPTIDRLVIRSHGVAGEGADLDNKSGQGLVHDPASSKGLSFLKKNLSNNASVVMTACNIIFDQKGLGNSAKQTESNFSSFFVEGTNRSLFLNYAKSTSRENVAEGQIFNFNKNMHQDKYGGFARYKNVNGTVTKSSNYFNVSISSGGTINISTITYPNKPIPADYKKVKK
jgi:RHS repeat-associated protein